jgi:hypothetical protein
MRQKVLQYTLLHVFERGEVTLVEKIVIIGGVAAGATAAAKARRVSAEAQITILE